MKVTLDKEKLKASFKKLLLNEIVQRAQNWQHTNSSGVLSPAQWWVDKPVYQGAEVRHQLATDIETSIVDDTLQIRVIFAVEDISPNQ